MRKRGTILVVDDEPVIRGLLVRSIAREGYQVSEATNGREALELLKMARFDIVISDIKMPEMDGMELLTEIRSSYPSVSVILITGYGAEYNSQDVIAAGADYFITKPFKNVEIAHTLETLFQRRQRQSQAE
jgi:CheY-like chemotaxis protein